MNATDSAGPECIVIIMRCTAYTGRILILEYYYHSFMSKGILRVWSSLLVFQFYR